MLFGKNDDLSSPDSEKEVSQLEEKGPSLGCRGQCQNCCKKRKKQFIDIEDLYGELFSNL